MALTRTTFVDDSNETRLSGFLVPPAGASAGDVPQATGTDGEPAQWAAGGGSSALTVVNFSIPFDLPNLLTGVTVYSPTAGDRLLATGWSCPTAFDGTTPNAHLLLADLDFADQGLSSADSPITGGSELVGAPGLQAFGLDGTQPLVLTVDDGSGGDPGSTVGLAGLFLLIVPNGVPT